MHPAQRACCAAHHSRSTRPTEDTVMRCPDRAAARTSPAGTDMRCLHMSALLACATCACLQCTPPLGISLWAHTIPHRPALCPASLLHDYNITWSLLTDARDAEAACCLADMHVRSLTTVAIIHASHVSLTLHPCSTVVATTQARSMPLPTPL
jgi:hypothetical protein